MNRPPLGIAAPRRTNSAAPQPNVGCGLATAIFAPIAFLFFVHMTTGLEKHEPTLPILASDAGISTSLSDSRQ